MGQLYLYSTKWEKNAVVVLRIYEARAIFIIFYYEQDTVSTCRTLVAERY